MARPAPAVEWLQDQRPDDHELDSAHHMHDVEVQAAMATLTRCLMIEVDVSLT